MEWLGFPALDKYKGLDIAGLPLNHAWVIANTSQQNIGVFSVRDDCFNCPYKIEKHLTPNQLDSWKVEVGHLTSWRVVIEGPDEYMNLHYKKGWICQMRPTFEEYGVYRLDIGTCQVRPEVQPVNTYYPLLLFSLALMGICSISTGLRFLWRRRKEKKEVKEETREKVVEVDEIKEGTFTALDVYRGILIALIIFFTTGGGGYPIFINDWGGITVAECVFFAYIWSIGVRIPTVMAKAFKEQTKCAAIRDISVRTFFLVLLGTAIDSTVEDQRSTLRLWCPLQKIGIAYFFVATAYMLTVQRFEIKSKKLISKALTNVVSLLWCWIIAGFLLSLLTILISTFASFNCLGNIDLFSIRAEELDIREESENCNNDLSENFNRILVGRSLKITNFNNYFGFSRGAMGILSTMIHMMIGLKSGVVYLTYKDNSDRVNLWGLWASFFGIGGICFAVASYPLNFNLWPISTILFISTVATYVFSLVYFITDVFKFTSNLLSSLGITSLVILCGHMLFSNTMPFMWDLHLNNHLFYLMQNLWIVLLWLIVAVLLKRRDVKFDM